MQGADLALIKDIPGYQIIMKAVLKHQIQQLVRYCCYGNEYKFSQRQVWATGLASLFEF